MESQENTNAYINKAAEAIIAGVKRKIVRNTIGVAVFGQYDCNAKEICQQVASLLDGEDYTVLIIAEDDYYRLTPAANLTKRIEDLSWIGPQEVRLELLDSHMAKLVKGKGPIEKPVIVPGEEQFETEQLPAYPYDLILVYGCYTGYLEHVQYKVFIEPEKPSQLPTNNPIFLNIYNAEKEAIEKQIASADLVIKP